MEPFHSSSSPSTSASLGDALAPAAAHSCETSATRCDWMGASNTPGSVDRRHAAAAAAAATAAAAAAEVPPLSARRRRAARATASPLLILLALFACVLGGARATPVAAEKNFIAAIVEGLGADATDFAECNAAGGALQCDAQNYTTAIFYSDKGVTGTLSRAIWSLTRLTRLDLSENALHGVVPALTKTPAAAPKLTRLDLSNNALQGALPPSLAVLPLFDTGGLCVLSGAAHAFACPLPLYASTSCGLQTACSSVPCASAAECDAFSPDQECLVGACSSTGACYWTAKQDFAPCVAACNPVGYCRRGSCAPYGSIPSCPGTVLDGFQCSGRGECCADNSTSTYCACDDSFEGVDCYSAVTTTTTAAPSSTAARSPLDQFLTETLYLQIFAGLAAFLCILVVCAFVAFCVLRPEAKEKEKKAKKKSKPVSIGGDDDDGDINVDLDDDYDKLEKRKSMAAAAAAAGGDVDDDGYKKLGVVPEGDADDDGEYKALSIKVDKKVEEEKQQENEYKPMTLQIKPTAAAPAKKDEYKMPSPKGAPPMLPPPVAAPEPDDSNYNSMPSVNIADMMKKKGEEAGGDYQPIDVAPKDKARQSLMLQGGDDRPNLPPPPLPSSLPSTTPVAPPPPSMYSDIPSKAQASAAPTPAEGGYLSVEQVQQSMKKK